MELIKLLETQLQKKVVGTLTLGKRNSFREVFFEGDQLYVVGDLYSGRIHLDRFLCEEVIGRRIGIDKLEALILNTDLTRHMLPQVLHDQGFLAEEELHEVTAIHLVEESVDLLHRNAGSFHFQEGRVPEYLLKCEAITVRISVPIEAILYELRRRTDLMAAYQLLIPSEEEVFVLTEKGMGMKQEGSLDLVIKRILDLIDGFRNLRLLIQDSRLYEFHVIASIAKCLEDGFIKKTIHPELKGLSTQTFTKADAERYLPFFKNAVKHGVDELAARERLAVVYEKLGKTEDAVIQYNFIGDALFRMRKPAKAVLAYQHALMLKPGEILITDKITKIYREAAEEEIANGNTSQAIGLFENALRIQPGDREVFHQLLSLLLKENKLKEISDLCDEIVSHARKMRCAEVGIQACQDIIRELPRSAALKKKLINLYLDFDMRQEATEVMEGLAREYFERGQAAKAHELIEKIRRSGVPGPESRAILKQLEGVKARLGTSPPKGRTGIRVAVLLVLSFCFYQAWAFRSWNLIRNRHAFAEALERSETPVATLLPGPDESRSAALSKDLNSFLRLHVLSVFRWDAAKLRLVVEERLGRHRAKREKRIRGVLGDAKVHLREGRRKELEALLGPLFHLDPGDRLRLEAEGMVSSVSRFPASAQELHEKAQSLELAEDWKGAHRVYRNILEWYPQSEIVNAIRIPLFLQSLPPGADVSELSPQGPKRALGRTPFVLSLSPGQSVEVEVSTPGYSPLRAEIQGLDGHEKIFTLEREHAWTVALDGNVEVPPAISGDTILCGTNRGTLAAIERATGQVRWRLKGSAIRSIVSPPAPTPHGIFTVWNNGRILRLGGDARGEPSAEGPPQATADFFLGGLATSPLHRLKDGKNGKDGQLLLIGTKSGHLQAYDARTASPAWSLPIEGEAESIQELEGDDVLAVTRTGILLRVRTRPPGIVWKRSFHPPEAFDAARSGDAVVVATRRNDLIFLNPADGSTLNTKAFPERSIIRLAAPEEKVYILGADGELSSVSVRTGEPIGSKKLRIRHHSLFVLPGALVLVEEKRRSIYFIDPGTLEPSWSTGFAKDVRGIAGDERQVFILLEGGQVAAVER